MKYVRPWPDNFAEALSAFTEALSIRGDDHAGATRKKVETTGVEPVTPSLQS